MVITIGCSNSKVVNVQFELIQQKKLSVIQPNLETIKAIAISKCGKYLYVSDGSIIGKSTSDLIILNTTDLSVKKTFKISRKMSDNYPWSSSSIAIDQKNERLLLYNQFINLKNGKIISEINLRESIDRKNVYPEPLAISPNGKMALIIVGSYYDSEEDSLSLYQLKTGKLIKVIDKGKNIKNGNACFINDNEVISLAYDGSIFKYSLSDSTKETLNVSGPSPPLLFLSKNMTMQSIQQGKRLLLVGGDEFSILDTESSSLIYNAKLDTGNAIFLNSNQFILQQQSILNQSTNRWNNHFTITNIESKKTINSSELESQFFQLFIMDNEEKYLYAITYDSLNKFKIKK